MISIHAPLAGSDARRAGFYTPHGDFNPRSPCGERPARAGCGRRIAGHFNPRSPCGERPGKPRSAQSSAGFQSTLPLRGATPGFTRLCLCITISIHAPLAGSDCEDTLSLIAEIHFNPRSPCGERPDWEADRSAARYFNPRSPCGERPWRIRSSDRSSPFQSTLPLRGATRHDVVHGVAGHDFNPRSPCGERRRLKPHQT